MIRAWAPLPGNAVPTKVPTIEEPNPQPPEPIFPQTDDLSEAAEQPIAPVESVPLTSPIITPEAELPSDSVPPTRPLLAEQAPLPTVQTSSMAPVLASALRHDYAWLSETIMRRMQELKTYPADARLDRAEGKVVLKTVIRSDGDVERVEVFQSSGHHSLDQAAVELLHRAAPFQFPRPLEKPQVTVKIPLRYRLE
jgi:protein TonB